MSQTVIKEGFGYKISSYFFANRRLTILALVFIIFLGVASLLFLKTTGFPTPKVNVMAVSTVYPGASPQTITDTITKPIEGAIKDVDGVSSYSSISRNSVSIVSINVDEQSNLDTVQNQIEAVVTSITLPEEAQTPKVIVPQIGDPTLVLSVAGNNIEDIYAAYTSLAEKLSDLPETSKITPMVELRRVADIQLDTVKMQALGITTDAVQHQLATIGETLPVVSDVTIEGQSQTIQTSVTGTTLDDIKNIEFTSTSAQSSTPAQVNNLYGAPSTQTAPLATTVKLTDIAAIEIDYQFADQQQPVIGVHSTDSATGVVVPAITVQVYTAAGSDLSDYTERAEGVMHTLEVDVLSAESKDTLDPENTTIVEHYTSDQNNQRQVNEVISGLIGGELPLNSNLKYLGWILGGMQLVFLVMLAFVSWRAAIVASLAIPLSLVFSTIYLYLTGNDLNTLVLFSLVLVIGLVVDPALVILESIQRKIDAGLKGKAAALAAIQDVGGGLFMASLTNIIVFAPFGLISGILGQIFSYIPLTIIPAVVGSYIVPLIFLAWLGSLFLRPKRGSVTDEEQNLWSVARWIIKVNTKILQSPVWIRTLIIAIALVVPVVIAGYYVNTGKVSVVQFAGGLNADYIQVTAQFTPTATLDERNSNTQALLTELTQNSAVRQVYPFAMNGAIMYRLNLAPAPERGDYISTVIAKDLRAALSTLPPTVSDFVVHVEATGPPVQSYQIALSIADNDTQTLRTAALDVATVLNQVCYLNNQVAITEQCDGERIITKVDDGYTGQETQVIDVSLDRNKLSSAGLALTQGPISGIVNNELRALFNINNNEAVQTIELDGQTTDIILSPQADAPDALTDLSDVTLIGQAGPKTLTDVATVTTTSTSPSIQRLKGQTIALVQGRLDDTYNNQQVAQLVTQAVLDYYQNNDSIQTTELNLASDAISSYSDGFAASNNKSFQELFLTLFVAILLTYIVLALFFDSFMLPLVILFAIPLTFIGIFPGLYTFAGAQIGFLEIIGLIMLVGIVENVAIFLIDAARQKINEAGWDEKRAIAYASGIRLRPVLLTKLTATASLLPLAFLSDVYQSLAVVIICGLLTSGITSLFTTPILFVFFRWASRQFWPLNWWKKILYIVFFPAAIIILGIKQRKGL